MMEIISKRVSQAHEVHMLSSVNSSDAASTNADSYGSNHTPPIVADDTDDHEGDRKRRRDENEPNKTDLECRRAKNRLSAHQSRLRKRNELASLQTEIIQISAENEALKTMNEKLLTELAQVRASNASLLSANRVSNANLLSAQQVKERSIIASIFQRLAGAHPAHMGTMDPLLLNNSSTFSSYGRSRPSHFL